MVPSIQKNKSRQRESGLAYVAILILVAIMSTLGLSFLSKVGILSSAATKRIDGMRADYLAESAVHHARWGLLNVPGFAPDPNIYYMHSFASGRYGYKVRKPTLTTFATVATVGVVGENVVQQSYVPYILPSNIMTAYGQNNNPIPQCRRLIGADWSTPFDSVDVLRDPIIWVDLAGCPVREEFILGTIDDDNDINLAVWQDGTWAGPWEFSIDVDKNYKCFDIAYESQSNRALIVGRYDDTTTMRYNIWNGTTMDYVTPEIAFNLTEGKLRYLTMQAQPGSDEILIAAVSDKEDLHLCLWNGAGFNDLGKIEDVTATTIFGIVEIVYEQQSGDALILWSQKDSTAISYRIWDGCGLSPVNQLPSIGTEAHIIRADADPDYIFVVAMDKEHDINVAVWDGESWIDSRELEIDGESETDPVCFDAAWESSGNEVLVVWGQNGLSQVRYFPWTKGTLLSSGSMSVGPDFLNRLRGTYLLPASGSDRIILLANNKDKDIRYALWTGNRLVPDPSVVLEVDMAKEDRLPFAVAEMLVPRTGGSGSGTCTQMPPTVDAGPNQTIVLPSDATLDGTVTDDGLPNPPATVTTTWSKQSGPGTVTFGDASLVDTTATFSEAGTYVLRLTADDSDLTAFDEVTIIVKSCSLLYVVKDPLALQSQESQRITLMESWGFIVTLIDDNDTQANFDQAVLENDVAYVSFTIQPSSLGTKLDNTSIGVVDENMDLYDTFGFCERGLTKASQSIITILDNTHYITSGFPMGDLTIVSSTQTFSLVDVSFLMAPDLGILAEASGASSDIPLSVLETGAQRWDGGTAAGRRVQLPWDAGAFDIATLNTDGQMIMKRAIEWAAHWEGGCSGFISCNADYVPDTKIGEFSTSAYGSGSIEGIGYLPEGKSFNLTAVPVGGALISVDMGDMFYMTDLAGNFLTSLATGSGTHTGVTLVQTGTWADHLAVSDKFNDEIKYFDLTGNFISSFSTNVSADFNGTTPEDVAFIGTTESGTYDDHLAIPDLGRDKVFLVDQNGNWVSSIDTGALMANPKGAAHLPGTDKLLLVDSGGQAFIIDFAGNLLNQYGTAPFGTGSPLAITINPLTCDHLVGDASSDLVVTLNLSGGGSDTDPPTPDPMTWASPPAPGGPTSITMTATTATDPSGVEYYFECTAGGGNDSGWQDSPTFVDTGLAPATLYTYRVKARDKSSNQNETGWSSENSATTGTAPEMYVNDIAMGFRTQGPFYFGQATVWIKDDWGVDIAGALVMGDWSGAVSETAMGTTGGDGKIFFESPRNGGGTYTFTVTGVSKSGYVYNPTLNVETSDSITVP
jgi:hypothetical protein